VQTMPKNVGREVLENAEAQGETAGAAENATVSGEHESAADIPTQAQSREQERERLLARCHELGIRTVNHGALDAPVGILSVEELRQAVAQAQSREYLIARCKEFGLGELERSSGWWEYSTQGLQNLVADREAELKAYEEKPLVTIEKIEGESTVYEGSRVPRARCVLSNGGEDYAIVFPVVGDTNVSIKEADALLRAGDPFELKFEDAEDVRIQGAELVKGSTFQLVRVHLLADYRFDEAERCWVRGQTAIVPAGQPIVAYHPNAIRLPVLKDAIIAQTGLPENVVDIVRQWIVDHRLYLLDTAMGFYESLGRFHDPKGFYAYPELILYAVEDYALTFRKAYKERGGNPQELVDVYASLKAVRAAVKLNRNVMEHKKLLRTMELATPVLPAYEPPK
jgi:hypothetical protein